MGIIEWAHRRETPAQRRAWAFIKSASLLRVPTIPGVHHLLLAERRFRRGPLSLFWSKFYHEPLLRMQCQSVGPGLLLLEGMPKILGNLRVTIGARAQFNGEQVWLAAGDGSPRYLTIGDDAGIGHRTEFIIGSSITIGNHVMIANRVCFLGYDGHPLDPFARARHEPPGPDGSAPIVVKDYAWIGSDCSIVRGVTIGRGAIVAARSVVKSNVPDLTVVSGNPAKPVWKVEPPAGWD